MICISTIQCSMHDLYGCDARLMGCFKAVHVPHGGWLDHRISACKVGGEPPLQDVRWLVALPAITQALDFQISPTSDLYR